MQVEGEANGLSEFEQLLNEFAHLSITRPINRQDCVWVTVAHLLSTDVVSLAAQVPVLRPQPSVDPNGLSLDQVKGLLQALGRQIQ
jgi:hypothetical protein